ncbi:hypothetical protein QS278_27100, partial [Escherichia coli]|nr:hypothetical protein [Escherichia coli]
RSQAREQFTGAVDRIFDTAESVCIASVARTVLRAVRVKWFTEFGHLNRGDMLTSEQHRCHNEKKKFQRRV